MDSQYGGIAKLIENRGCNKMYIFTFSLQPFLHAETTKVLETVVSQDIYVAFPFLGALK